VGGKAETSSAILCRSSGNSLGVIEACDFGCGYLNTLRNPCAGFLVQCSSTSA
jgi:hypothetical protein